MKHKLLAAALALLCFIGLAQALTLDSGITLEVGATNYTFDNNQTTNNLNFTTDSLVLDAFALKIIPSADTLDVQVHKLTSQDINMTETPDSSITAAHNITGFVSDTYVNIIRDDEYIKQIQSDSETIFIYTTTSYAAATNFRFTTYEPGITYPGTCTTPYGLTATYAGHDVILNLTNLVMDGNHLCSDVSCNNIKVVTKTVDATDPLQPVYTEAAATRVEKVIGKDYLLWINRGDADATGITYSQKIYVSGYNYNYNYDTTAYTGTPTVNQTELADLTVGNSTYMIIPRYEETDEIIDDSELDNSTLKVYCDTYAPYTIKLKFYSRTNYLITTRERPHIETKLANNTYTNTRRKATLTNWNTITTYNLGENTSTVTYYFILEDYTGEQRKDGYLDIKANINGTARTVHREKWYFNQIYNVTLRKDVDYQVTTVIPNQTTINYGWIHFSEDGGYKTLAVTQPITDSVVDHYEGLYYRYLFQPSPFVLGYAYNFTTASTINFVRFTVYNSSDEVIYTVNATTPSAQLTWSSGNENLTYRTRLDFDVDDHSYKWIENLYKGTFRTIQILREKLDLDEINILGIAGVKVERFMAWFMISFVGLIASAGNFGLIAIALILISSLMSLIGWLPDVYFQILVIGTALMAVGGRMFQTRQGKGVN